MLSKELQLHFRSWVYHLPRVSSNQHRSNSCRSKINQSLRHSVDMSLLAVLSRVRKLPTTRTWIVASNQNALHLLLMTDLRMACRTLSHELYTKHVNKRS